VSAEVAIWHDVECGAYDADLGLWRELAAAADGPVLDVGAGTGRIALDLARHGHDVVALDADPDLIGECARRAAAARLTVETVCADARDFSVPREVALVIVPMQTLQLLGGADGRARFLRCAARCLRPGGTLAAALANALDDQLDEDGWDGDLRPMPDIREIDGTVYASHPIRVRREPGGVVIERIRETVAPDGRRNAEGNEIRLDDVDAETVAREAQPLGFRARPALTVPATDDYVGSEVVVLWRT
jgi:SAM-dependent methyltransferase